MFLLINSFRFSKPGLIIFTRVLGREYGYYWENVAVCLVKTVLKRQLSTFHYEPQFHKNCQGLDKAVTEIIFVEHTK